MEVTLQNNYETIIREPVEKQVGLVVEKMRRPGGFVERELYLKQQEMVKGKHGESIQKYHTPFFLCDQMLRKLQDYTGFIRGKRILIYNIEFLDFLYRYGIMLDNEVWFINENPNKVNFANAIYIGDRNDKFIVDEFLKLDENMKFDIIVMNPPYEAPQEIKNEKGKKGGGTTLWDKFIVKSLDLLNPDGYLCSVNPSRWRKYTDPLWSIMKDKQIQYLEIHNEKDGLKTFGAETRYDWYVLQNKPIYDKTTIKGQDGKNYSVDLRQVSFLPNDNIEKITSLIAKPYEERVEILYSRSDYGTDKKNMSKEKNDEFKYPSVYSINKEGTPTYFYSNVNDKGFFGVPKVIFASGRISSANFILDSNGEFGLTQFAKGIVDTPKNLPLIQKAMQTDEFKRVMESCAISTMEIDKDILKIFRKDFWKEFVK